MFNGLTTNFISFSMLNRDPDFLMNQFVFSVQSA